MVLLPLAIIGIYAILKAAGKVVLVFTIAGLVALLLNPIVALVQRIRVPRGAAVSIVMVTLIALLVGLGFLLANPISDQASTFQRNVPHWVNDANKSLSDLQDWLDRKNINIQVKEEGQTALQTLGDNVAGGTGDVVNFTRDALQTLVESVLALILIIVLTVYMLLYGDRIGAVVRAVVPPGDGTPEDDFPTRIQAALFGYVRGQLLFSLAMGTGAGLGLYAFGLLGIFPDGKTYAFAFAIFFGLMELIPFVGPFLGALPPVLVALFQDPLTALWVALLFLALQQLEGHVVAPNVFGHTLRINPLLVIFSLLVGGEVAGFVGALMALPIAAIVRETVVYLRRHLVLEPWGTGSPATLTASGPAPPPPPPESEEEREEVPSPS